MSAPEVQVRVTVTHHEADDFGPAWTSYEAECSECGKRIQEWREPEMREWAQRHEETCAPLRLARLQARWDARVEAERALVEQWRERADDMELVGTRAQQWGAHCVDTAADELERAIGGGEK